MAFMESSWSVFLRLNGPSQGLAHPGQGSCLLSGAVGVLGPKAVPCHAMPAAPSSPPALPGTAPWHLGAASALRWLWGRTEVLPSSSSLFSSSSPLPS